MNLEVLYGAKIDYTRMRVLFEGLKDPRENLAGKPPTLATLCMNLGNLYSNKADYDTCDIFYFKSLRTRQEILQADHPEYSKSL